MHPDKGIPSTSSMWTSTPDGFGGFAPSPSIIAATAALTRPPFRCKWPAPDAGTGLGPWPRLALLELGYRDGEYDVNCDFSIFLDDPAAVRGPRLLMLPLRPITAMAAMEPSGFWRW